MTDPTERLTRAEADAAAARQRLAETMARLQDRLEPRRLVREARLGLADARHSAVERAGVAVRRRPATLAGVVALAGLWLGRHRVVALFRRRQAEATSDDDAS